MGVYMVEEDDRKALYWQPRIMRHKESNGEVWFGIHEVFFGPDDEFCGCTGDALSSRETTVENLKLFLIELSKSDDIVSGDLGYNYEKEDVDYWIECCDWPVIDYPED
jgi:hypothetical protein